jgi:UDPglucose--hexose-1-phosphate uridylyltransferase
MSRMRKDILTGRWVIIDDSRTVQTSDFRHHEPQTESGTCPFCQGNEASTPPELFVIRRSGSPKNGPGWSVRVVANAHPCLRVEGQLDRRAEGIHDLMNGVGAHEIIVETPTHGQTLSDLKVSDISSVFQAWAVRMADLEHDQRIRYVLIFKNHGLEAGAHSITHSISQLMALAATPFTIKSKLMTAREYYVMKERCIFCDVIQQELAQPRRLISQNSDFVAFAPFASRFPFEIAVFPKFHNSAFSRISSAQTENLAALMQDVLRKLDRALSGPSFNLALQDRPFLRTRGDYWKTIEDDFHWHLEILPQVFRVTGFEWASGFFYNPVPPETAARLLCSGDDQKVS